MREKELRDDFGWFTKVDDDGYVECDRLEDVFCPYSYACIAQGYTNKDMLEYCDAFKVKKIILKNNLEILL